MVTFISLDETILNHVIGLSIMLLQALTLRYR